MKKHGLFIVKKLAHIFLCVAVVLCFTPLSAVTVLAAPLISLDSTSYSTSQTITVTYSGTDTLDWVGLYPEGSLPGGVNALIWNYAVGSGQLTFSVSSLDGPGNYVAYLCDNDGYTVLHSVKFTVLDNDTTDYGVQSASVTTSVTNGKSSASVTITPSSAASLTYCIYWSKNGARLNGYLPLKTFTHSGSATFTVQLNDCLFMPDEADGIEVAVTNGRSTSFFTSVSSELKVPDSELLYEFQVITDMHIADYHAAHTPNLKAALNDIAALSSDSQAIFSVGDLTDKGTQSHYDLLLETINGIEAELPPIYYAMGNHDMVWSGTYDEQVTRFLENMDMPGVSYAVDIAGSRFIVLGSDVQTGEGELSEETLDWFEAQLKATDPNVPAFVFLHQPLKNTVSGTLTELDATIQDWYGFVDSGDEIRKILKHYPNAVLFSGHTHWSLEQTQPLLYGNGTDASFMNAASVGYLWSDEDESVSGSEGLYVEVYEDYILIKGREYTQGVWCAAAQFLIPLHEVSTDPYEGNLLAQTAEDWQYDNDALKIEKTDTRTVFSTLNDASAHATYTYTESITFRPEETSLYYDFILDENATADVCVYVNGEAISLNRYISASQTEASSGKLIGNGNRARGVIDMSAVAFADSCYNNNGTITIQRTQIGIDGDAGTNLTVFDLSLVNDLSDQTITLLRPDTLTVKSEALEGGYTYDNGVLTVSADSDEGYTVNIALNETYNVSVLANWLVNIQASVPFNISLDVTAANGSKLGPNLVGDYWPMLCTALDNGYLPAGEYDTVLDYYSCYTYNKVAPDDGMSTIKSVTIELAGAGEVTVNTLQLSSDNKAQVFSDDIYISKTTPEIVLQGDINGDGVLNTSDARYALRHVVGTLKDLTETQKTVADMNGDGSITTTDVRQMLKSIVYRT